MIYTTSEQRKILRHALGLYKCVCGKRYRNFYCADKDHINYDDLEYLVSVGLMVKRQPDAYIVTDEGRRHIW